MASHPATATSATPALARTPVWVAMQLGLFEGDPEADLRTLAWTMAERTIHVVVPGVANVVVPGVANARRARGRLARGIVSDIELMRAPAGNGADVGGRNRSHGGRVRPGIHSSMRHS
jgi:hypothetical protein